MTTPDFDSTEGLRGWFAGRLPEDWFTEAPSVVVDREEVTVIGRLAEPELPEGGDAGTGSAAQEAARAGRVKAFREHTRAVRMAIAAEVEHRSSRKVAWGVTVGEEQWLFTHVAAPVMTRLRQPERLVLDTLVDSGVARSRADALAWCVRLVGQHTGEWLDELRTAMAEVERVRRTGPAAR